MSNMNFEEYLKIKDCKYHRAFPSLNSDTLHVVCTRSVSAKTLNLPHYQYAPQCSECVGGKCENKELFDWAKN